MTAMPIPPGIDCTCLRGDVMHPVTDHATSCPTHTYIMEELYRLQPREKIMGTETFQQSIRWRVSLRGGGERIYVAPNCNTTEQGVLVIGGPNMVAAILASGEWRMIEDLSAIEESEEDAAEGVGHE